MVDRTKEPCAEMQQKANALALYLLFCCFRRTIYFNLFYFNTAYLMLGGGFKQCFRGEEREIHFESGGQTFDQRHRCIIAELLQFLTECVFSTVNHYTRRAQQ